MLALEPKLHQQLVVAELEAAAAQKIIECQAELERRHGQILFGIEDEFTIHGVSYHREEELMALLTEVLSAKYGSAFQRIDREHPLIRVRDSIEAGSNQALHMPDTFRLELVTNHELEEGESQETHIIHKAKTLRDMRQTIMEVVEGFEQISVVSHNPRPIPDVYYYLTNVSAYEKEQILKDIKAQAEERQELIGRDRILAATTLEELFFSDSPVLENYGAAGSGVHLNVGFRGEEGENPLFNSENPDIGTPVTWNAAAGIIDVTAESILSFTNLAHASWRRLGHSNLSAPTHAGYHPLKKSGAIVKQNPYTERFYRRHGIPAKEFITPENAHLEVRHADAGFGLRDGASLTMLQMAATLTGMLHGLRQSKITSYDQLLAYSKPLCPTFDESLAKFQASPLLPQIYGDRLYQAVGNFAALNATRLEEVWDEQILEEGDREYDLDFDDHTYHA